MKNNILLPFMFALLVFTGCRTVPRQKAESEGLPPWRAQFEQAEAHAQNGQWEQAYKIYVELQGEATGLPQQRELQLKIAEALCEMRKFAAALAALAPMPELPSNLHDCRKLAMASGILEKMNGKAEHVEALLEVALDNSIEEPGAVSFKAAGYAQMGRIYAAHGKTSRAIKCFEYAAQLFERLDDEEQAAACRNIMEYLR